MFEFYVVSVGVCFLLVAISTVTGWATGLDAAPPLMMAVVAILACIPLANLYLIWAFTEGIVFNLGAEDD